MSENINMDINNAKFNKVLKDFINDLIRTFPDILTEDSNPNLYQIINLNRKY